eukprot:TRINITY_DN87068_c0_g2_i1.p1 TRINITY_DN87068_c0_g2~~TRINITY_DN87068_c0_g2_i1.p1  ORF type:complete len:1858 (-),score=500.75 TRINITY_DN87068_c0_g2_i1:323-5896(-)
MIKSLVTVSFLFFYVVKSEVIDWKSITTCDQLRTIPADDFKSISGGDLKVIMQHPEICRGFLPTQLSSIPQELFANFTAKCAQNLPDNSCAGLTYMRLKYTIDSFFAVLSQTCISSIPSTSFIYVSPEQISSISPHSIPGLSERQMLSIPAKSYSGFLPDQIANFSYFTACRALSSQGLKNIMPNSFSGFTHRCIVELPETALSEVNADQIAHLDTSGGQNACNGLRQVHLMHMAMPAFAGFTPQCIASFKGADPCSGFVFSSLSNLKVDSLNAMTADCFGAVPHRAFRGITEEQVSHLSDALCAGLTTDMVPEIPPDSFAQFVPSCVAVMQPDSFSLLLASQVMQMPLSMCGDEVNFNLKMRTINAYAYSGFQPKCVAAWRAACVGVTSKGMGRLTTDAISALTAQCVGLMDPGVFADLALSQVSYLPPEVCSGMSSGQFAAISKDALPGITVDCFSQINRCESLSIEQTNALPAKVFRNITADCAKTMRYAEHLSLDQIKNSGRGFSGFCRFSSSIRDNLIAYFIENYPGFLESISIEQTQDLYQKSPCLLDINNKFAQLLLDPKILGYYSTSEANIKLMFMSDDSLEAINLAPVELKLMALRSQLLGIREGQARYMSAHFLEGMDGISTNPYDYIEPVFLSIYQQNVTYLSPTFIAKMRSSFEYLSVSAIPYMTKEQVEVLSANVIKTCYAQAIAFTNDQLTWMSKDFRSHVLEYRKMEPTAGYHSYPCPHPNYDTPLPPVEPDPKVWSWISDRRTPILASALVTMSLIALVLVIKLRNKSNNSIFTEDGSINYMKLKEIIEQVPSTPAASVFDCSIDTASFTGITTKPSGGLHDSTGSIQESVGRQRVGSIGQHHIPHHLPLSSRQYHSSAVHPAPNRAQRPPTRRSANASSYIPPPNIKTNHGPVSAPNTPLGRDSQIPEYDSEDPSDRMMKLLTELEDSENRRDKEFIRRPSSSSIRSNTSYTNSQRNHSQSNTPRSRVTGRGRVFTFDGVRPPLPPIKEVSRQSPFESSLSNGQPTKNSQSMFIQRQSSNYTLSEEESNTHMSNQESYEGELVQTDATGGTVRAALANLLGGGKNNETIGYTTPRSSISALPNNNNITANTPPSSPQKLEHFQINQERRIPNNNNIGTFVEEPIVRNANRRSMSSTPRSTFSFTNNGPSSYSPPPPTFSLTPRTSNNINTTRTTNTDEQKTPSSVSSSTYSRSQASQRPSEVFSFTGVSANNSGVVGNGLSINNNNINNNNSGYKTPTSVSSSSQRPSDVFSFTGGVHNNSAMGIGINIDNNNNNGYKTPTSVSSSTYAQSQSSQRPSEVFSFTGISANKNNNKQSTGSFVQPPLSHKGSYNSMISSGKSQYSYPNTNKSVVSNTFSFTNKNNLSQSPSPSPSMDFPNNKNINTEQESSLKLQSLMESLMSGASNLENMKDDDNVTTTEIENNKEATQQPQQQQQQNIISLGDHTLPRQRLKTQASHLPGPASVDGSVSTAGTNNTSGAFSFISSMLKESKPNSALPPKPLVYATRRLNTNKKESGNKSTSQKDEEVSSVGSEDDSLYEDGSEDSFDDMYVGKPPVYPLNSTTLVDENVSKGAVFAQKKEQRTIVVPNPNSTFSFTTSTSSVEQEKMRKPELLSLLPKFVSNENKDDSNEIEEQQQSEENNNTETTNNVISTNNTDTKPDLSSEVPNTTDNNYSADISKTNPSSTTPISFLRGNPSLVSLSASSIDPTDASPRTVNTANTSTMYGGGRQQQFIQPPMMRRQDSITSFGDDSDCTSSSVENHVTSLKAIVLDEKKNDALNTNIQQQNNPIVSPVLAVTTPDRITERFINKDENEDISDSLEEDSLYDDISEDSLDDGAEFI